MNDMRAVIIPKSDQINADDLVCGPMTITITEVTIRPGTEQPVSIHFDGDGGKPYKPCKSMARILVQCWGPDANQYTGRSMTLYRDPKVLWGGMAVGGIRISHMSDIDGAQTMPLTVTKGSRKPFTVRPLVVTQAPLIESARSAASRGTAAYAAFWKALTKDQRQALLPHHEDLKVAAQDADAAAISWDDPNNKVPAEAMSDNPRSQVAGAQESGGANSARPSDPTVPVDPGDGSSPPSTVPGAQAGGAPGGAPPADFLDRATAALAIDGGTGGHWLRALEKITTACPTMGDLSAINLLPSVRANLKDAPPEARSQIAGLFTAAAQRLAGVDDETFPGDRP